MTEEITVGATYKNARGEVRTVGARGYEPETVVYRTREGEVKSCPLEEFVRWMEDKGDGIKAG